MWGFTGQTLNPLPHCMSPWLEGLWGRAEPLDTHPKGCNGMGMGSCHPGFPIQSKIFWGGKGCVGCASPQCCGVGMLRAQGTG